MRKAIRSIAWVVIVAVVGLAGEKTQLLNLNKVESRLVNVVTAVQANLPVSKPNAGAVRVVAKKSGIEPMYSVIVFASSTQGAEALNITPMSFNGKLYTANVTYDQLVQLSNESSVAYIEAPRMRYPKLDKSIVEMKVDKLHTGLVNSTIYKGKGVIVGVIDSGIDWTHLDFRSPIDTTKSRILYLWDQTDARTGIGPTGFNYGAEYTQTQINDEIDGTPTGVVLEQDINGHGTHVAGTAAGNGATSGGKYTGVAPEADLIIVKAGDGSFPTNHIIDGITYIRQKAEAAGKPFVINMSLGGHDGGHDGTTQEEISVDAELNGKTGRQIIIAAGNEGSDSIHAEGVVSQGGTSQIQFSVPTYTPISGSQNDYIVLSMWYKAGDSLTVKMTSPSSVQLTATPGTHQQSNSADGLIDIVNAQNGVNPNEIGKNCEITLVDFDQTKPPQTGTWTLTVTGSKVTQGGAFDVWIGGASIDPVKFTAGVTLSKLVGMPGTAGKSITVGAYVTKWSWTATDNNTYNYLGTDRTNNFARFSSMGPTRDGRQKPEVSAPGQAIAAPMSANSSPNAAFQVQGGGYVIEQGTSMATPHVTGLVALMLQAKPTLTTAKIQSILNSTARKDAFTGGTSSAQWGNGKVDAQAAVQTVLSVQHETAHIPSVFSLQQNYPNPFNPTTKIVFSIAQRSNVTLKIYSTLGKEVATLVNDQLESGEYSISFDATDLSSGVYFYTLKAGNFSASRKMMLMK
ncbi:MAG: S8 family peptidase [Bacteroidota bacterium]|nr:S8 family peptidase [Bacteroidota bacterium]